MRVELGRFSSRVEGFVVGVGMEGNVPLVVGGFEGVVLVGFVDVAGLAWEKEEGAVSDRFVLEELGWRVVLGLLLLSMEVPVLLELLPW